MGGYITLESKTTQTPVTCMPLRVLIEGGTMQRKQQGTVPQRMSHKLESTERKREEAIGNEKRNRVLHDVLSVRIIELAAVDLRSQ
jgi:hypothetical protein